MHSDRSHAPRERLPGARLNLARLAVGLALGGMAAGCGSVGQSVGDSMGDLAGSLAGMMGGSSATGSIAQARGTRVAFGPIEGAPGEVTARLAGSLAAEAAARQIAVVSADQAAYRLRGYLALRTDRGGATAITWAWDVYDSGLHRAFRLGGEETGRTAAGANQWTLADDALLHRIAQAGMTQLVDFIANGQPGSPAEPDAAPPAPSRPGTTVAAFAGGADR